MNYECRTAYRSLLSRELFPVNFVFLSTNSWLTSRNIFHFFSQSFSDKLPLFVDIIRFLNILRSHILSAYPSMLLPSHWDHKLWLLQPQLFKQTFCLLSDTNNRHTKKSQDFPEREDMLQAFYQLQADEGGRTTFGYCLERVQKMWLEKSKFTQIIKHNDANASAVSWSCQAPDNQKAPMVKHCSRVWVHASARSPDIISLSTHSWCLWESRYQVRKTPDGLTCLKVSS